MRNVFKLLSLVSQLGLHVFICIFLGGYGGYLLGKQLGVPSALMVIGVLIGIIAGYKGAYELIIKFSELDDKKKDGFNGHKQS